MNLIPINHNEFFISAEDDDNKALALNDWKGQLFIWHEESYYGSFVDSYTHEEIDGVKLNNYHLLTLLGNEQFSSFIQWNWSEAGDTLLALSNIMLEAIQDGHFVPQFSDDPDKTFQWKVPEVVWDEFGDEFWKQSFFDEPLNVFTQKFFHSALSIYIEQDGYLEKLHKIQSGPLSAAELSAYFDAKRWNEWIGHIGEEYPFTLGLRLVEPVEDSDPWQLETILRDRKNHEKLYTLKRLPKRWQSFSEKIEEEQQRWIRMFPWLDNKGTLVDELSETYAWEFLTDASGKLLTLGIDILLPSWWEDIKEMSLGLKAKVKQSNASYRPSFVGLDSIVDFDWRLSMNGAELSEDDFQSLIENKRKLIKVEGQWITLDPKMIAQLQSLMVEARSKGLRMQDLFLQGSYEGETEEIDPDVIDSRAFAQIKIELNQSLRKMFKQLHDLNELPNVHVSELLQGDLRPYQHLGFNWLAFLRKHGFGACLADDMGLGKTIQLITYLLHVKQTIQPETPALIICPTSVLGNWQRELERFAPDLKVHLHYGANRFKSEQFTENASSYDVILTSYGLSHLDFEELSTFHWSTIALDEAQNVKNASTKQSRAIRSLKGDHHIALTGTPMENRLAELWAIFDFINQGYLGSFNHFQKQFILPIERDHEEKKIQQLQTMIKPFLLRRTKKDPDVELNLPDKVEQKEFCPLTAEQAALYEDLVQETFNKIESLSFFERKGLILQMLNKLKQLCNHPALYLKETQPNQIENRSHKMKTLLHLTDNVYENDEACIIFTQYIGMGELIRDMLEKKYNLRVPFLNGSMKKTDRDLYVQQFQEGKFPFFILSLKAGGTGLNLTAANHVIHYDRWWNPAVENQATDRAYRIGQERFVHVHKFIATGTLEEKIDEMLDKKQALNDEIIQSEQWVTELSNDDLHQLLALT